MRQSYVRLRKSSGENELCGNGGKLRGKAHVVWWISLTSNGSALALVRVLAVPRKIDEATLVTKPTMRPRNSVVVPLMFGSLAIACAGGTPASSLAKAPDFEMDGQTKCALTASHTHPLIVEWPSSDRLELETKMRSGLVAVHYSDCTMQVLDRCVVKGSYGYLAATRKNDEVVIRSSDDLYASLPLGAAKLEGKLARAGVLTVDMSLVGRYEADKAVVRADDLTGDCAGATHYIYGVTVGAFDFYAGGSAKVGATAGIASAGVGGGSSAVHQTLTSDGDVEACAKATSTDQAPPDECGALLRLEVVPLGSFTPAVAASPAVATARFVGDWSCEGTVTATFDEPASTAPRASAVHVSESIHDNGDGTLTIASDAAAGTCAARYTVSGNVATLAGVQTCDVRGSTVTGLRGQLTLMNDTLTSAVDGKITGRAVVSPGGQPQAFAAATRGAATCRRR